MTNREQLSLDLGTDEKGNDKPDTITLNNAADKIFEQQTTKKFYTWEELTEDYLMKNIPPHSSKEDASYLIWVQERPKYVAALCKRFTEMEVDCYLDVDHTRGVSLLSGVEARNRINEKRTRKNISVLTRSMRTLKDNDIRVGAITPNPLISTMRVALMNIYGELDFTELSPTQIKKFKQRIRRSLPMRRRSK